MTMSDGNDSTETISTAVALRFIASDKERHLVVPDAYDLTQRMLGGVTGQIDAQERKDLCTLAFEGRLLCREMASRLACDAGEDLTDALAGSKPEELSRSGPEMMAFLGDIARSASVPNSTLATFGPLGLYSRVRGVVAIGVASDRGLTIDQRARAGAVEACRIIAKRRFEEVISHPDAPPMFKKGRAAQPDRKGFRPLHKDRVGPWLAGQLDEVTDALGIPIRPAMAADLANDTHLRNWPVWAFGTKPLIALADLQAAEYLGDQLGRLGVDDGRVRPRYSLFPRFATTGPDLVAYQRFRQSNDVAPVFVPQSDSAWIRVRLSNLPLVALATVLEQDVPSSTVAIEEPDGRQFEDRIRNILAECGISRLDAGQRSLLITLIASGASNKTTALVAHWLGRIGVSQEQVSQLMATLRLAWPEFKSHLADRTLGQLAKALGIESIELDSLIGQPAIRGPTDAFFHRYVGTGLSREVRFWCGGAEEQQALRLIRSGRFADDYHPASLSHLAGALGECRHKLTEPVVTGTGRVFAKQSWTKARSAFLHVAEDSLLDATFAVIAAGHRVVAITPHELLVEVPKAAEVDDVVAAITPCMKDAIANALGGRSVNLDLEQIERW